LSNEIQIGQPSKCPIPWTFIITNIVLSATILCWRKSVNTLSTQTGTDQRANLVKNQQKNHCAVSVLKTGSYAHNAMFDDKARVRMIRMKIQTKIQIKIQTKIQTKIQQKMRAHLK